jgi:hypothetical protein
MVTFSVIVGNIGTVCDGQTRAEAVKHYKEYVLQSKTEYGRASGETVTMFRHENGMESIALEYVPKVKLPTIAEIRSLLVSLKPTIGDEYRSEGCEDGPPSMDVTVGWTPSTGSWSYQTGDNSFTGGAYGHPHWAVISLNRRSNSTELAKDVIEQLADLHAMQ